MKYMSIDIETTGLDRRNDQILEIGAIIEDTNNILPYEECPKFHRYIKYNRYEGGAYALALNQRIFSILAKGEDKNIVDDMKMVEDFVTFMLHNSYNVKKGKFTVAGKNFRDFDYEFLNEIYEWKADVNFHRRVIDPAILYWKPLEDEVLPDQNLCLERAGIGEVVNHTALGDAWQVIMLIRKHFGLV